MNKQAEHMRDALIENRKSANAAKESAEVAQRTLEISQRANLGIEAIRLKFPPRASPTEHTLDQLFASRIELVIKNTGATEAKGFYFEMRVSIDGLDPDVKTPDPIVSHRGDLHAGSSRGTLTPELQQMFHRLHVQQAVTNGTLRVGGFVRYRNIFRETGYYIEYTSRFEPSTFDFEISAEAMTDEEQQRRAQNSQG